MIPGGVGVSYAARCPCGFPDATWASTLTLSRCPYTKTLRPSVVATVDCPVCEEIEPDVVAA